MNLMGLKVFFMFFLLAAEAVSAGYPSAKQVTEDINAELKKSKLEKVELTSKWALSWVDMSRKSFQAPDQAVCDAKLTWVKDAKGEQSASEAVVYYTRDILQPNLPWSYQKVDILQSKLEGRPDLTKSELDQLLIQALAKEERVRRLVLPQAQRLTKVISVGAAEPSEFKWSDRTTITFHVRVEYEDIYGRSDLRRMERIIRVGFQKRDSDWFMNDMGQPKDVMISKTEYAKAQLDGMKTLAKSSWSEIYQPGGASAKTTEAEKPYPLAKDVVAAVKQGLGASEKHFNQILGARVVNGKVEIQDLASTVYEIALKEDDVDFTDFKWGKDDGFSLPVKVSYWWKEVKERKAGPTVERTYWKKGESESFMIMFKQSSNGGWFVAGSVGRGMKKSIMDSRIGESTYGALPATYHERFATPR